MSDPRPLPALAAPHWAAAARGELALPHCRRCGHVWYPPSRFCPKCLADDIEWRAVSGRGAVVGWCRFHRPYFRDLPLALPYAVILVRLDEGPQLYSNPDSADWTPVVGQAVEATFPPVGPAEALVRFRPVDHHS